MITNHVSERSVFERHRNVYKRHRDDERDGSQRRTGSLQPALGKIKQPVQNDQENGKDGGEGNALKASKKEQREQPARREKTAGAESISFFQADQADEQKDDECDEQAVHAGGALRGEKSVYFQLRCVDELGPIVQLALLDVLVDGAFGDTEFVALGIIPILVMHHP